MKTHFTNGDREAQKVQTMCLKAQNYKVTETPDFPCDPCSSGKNKTHIPERRKQQERGASSLSGSWLLASHLLPQALI